VRGSIRYHDRRLAFFETLHRLTGALTVLLARRSSSTSPPTKNRPP